jgi:parallel beta-helix repeat protein
VTGVGYEKAKDFMDWHLSQAAANGKHLILTIEDKIYGGFPPSDLQNGLLLPLYLKTNPTYANPSDPAGNNGWYVLSPMGGGGLSVITRSYTPAVMDRYIALGQYLCSQYDGNSALEAITLSGVSVGMTPTQLAESGYSYTAYIEQVKRWLLAMKAACPKTTIGIRLDWPPTYQDALDFWQWAEQHGIAMSDYDTYDWPGRVGAVTPGQGESEGWGKSAFRGAADLGGGNPDPVNSGVAGTDLRGKLPWIGLVEDPDWTRWGQYGVDSMAEFLDIAQFEKYTHMVWAPITWAATPSQFNPPNEGNIWENIIRPCIERGVGCSNSSSGIYTTYPTNYPSSVSPSPTPTPTPSPTPTPTPGRMTIRIGDVVLNMATVAVWDNPGGRVIATLPPDTPGLVVGGPRDLGGYRWWQVQFDEGPTGWVYEHMLQNIQSTAPRGTATTQTTWCSLNGIASTSLAGTCDYVRNESLNINLSTVAGDALGTAELYDPTGSFKGKCGTMSSGPTGHLEIILKTSGTPGPNECVVKPNTDYYVNVSTIIDQLEIVPKPTREDYIVMYAPVTEGTVVQGTPTPNPTPTPSPSTPPPSLTPSIAGLSPTAPYPVTALQASSYFVSTQGNDSSDGRTPATAWRTLAKVNATTLPAGSNVFFRAGEQWNTERLNVTWGGTASDPAVIGSYFIDGTGQAMVGVGNNLRPVFDNQYDARGLYGNVITISSDNVTIQDIEIRNAGDMGVRADRHTNIYVKNVKVDGSYHCGMYFNRDTNVTVEFSEAYNHNTGYGVFGTERTWCNGLAQESTNVTFRNNIVADGYGEGIGAMRGVSGFLYENNILRNNRAVGIYIDSAHDGIVRNNVIYMTGNSPFSGREFGIGLSNEAYQYVANGGNTPSTEYVRNMQIYNNIVAGHTGGAAIGMYDEMGFPYENIQVVNNTFIDNKYGVDAVGTPGTTWPASFVFANNIILSQSSFARDIGNPIRSTATVLNNYWSQGTPGGGMDSPGDVYAGLQLQKNSGWSALGPGGFTWQDALPVGNSPTIGAGSQSAGVLHPTADIGGNMFGSPIDMGAVASSPSPSTPSTPSIRSIPTNVRIMPLGDSITEGSWSTAGTDFSGYRSPLYSLLTAAGISPTFVGSATNGNFAQPNHEGHGGYSIQDIFTNIDGWLAANTPDVVLLHIGTNDILGDNDLANAGARLRVLIRRIASQAPNARIVVAQIAPFANATDEAQAVQYNRDIATSVTTLRNEGIKVTLVDMHTALTASVDLYDGVHPNDNGYIKMAPTWLSGIYAAYQPAGSPPPPPVPPGSFSPNFPRLAADYVSPNIWGNSTYRDYLARNAVVVFTHWNGAQASAGISMADAMRDIKSKVPVSLGAVPVHTIYIVNNEVFKNDTATQRLRDKLLSENWYLYDGAVGGTIKDSSYGGGTHYAVNNTSWAPKNAQGKNWIEWYADLMVTQNVTGEAGNSPNPYVDGFFLDNTFWKPRTGLANYDHQGTGNESDSDTAVQFAQRNGLRQYFDYIRQIWPSARYQMGNTSDLQDPMGADLYASNFTPDTTRIAPLAGVVDGGLAGEYILGTSLSREYQERNNGATSWNVLRNEIRFLDAAVRVPALNIYSDREITADNTTQNWKNIRFGLGAITVLSDGAFDDQTFMTSSWLPDEYSNAGAGVGWLGQAVEGPQYTAWQNGVYKREFQNGIVLVNPRNNGQQTVTLPGTFKKITGRSGRSDLSINNGQTVTTVTLGDRDGLFLLRSSPLPTPTPTPPPQSNGANLLFATGFEGGVTIDPPGPCWGDGCWQNLSGTDSQTGFSFPMNIWGGLGRFQLIYGPGNSMSPSEVSAELTNSLIAATGPRGTQTRVLRQEMKSKPYSYTQNVFQIQPGTPPREFYTSVYIRPDPSVFSTGLRSSFGSWYGSAEWKSSGDYRLGGGIRDYGSGPEWYAMTDNAADGGLPYQYFEQQTDPSFGVPTSRWYRIEMYTLRSAGADGRMVMAVDGRVLWDRRGPNYGINNAEINRVFPFLLYTAGAPSSHLVDDLEIWDGIPGTASFR